MKKTFAAVAVTSLLLSACASNYHAGGQTPAAVGSGQPGVTTPSGSPSASPVPALSPSPSLSPSPPPKAAASPTAVTGVKSYKMNKNYDIVPVDPNGNKKVVLLTFDDGPKEKAMIDGLIDTLDKHKAKAVFFVNGYRIKMHPELLKLIADRGQIIGNHSWDHIDLKKENNDKIDKQLQDVQAIVKELTGSAPQFFRPPFGSGNDHVREKAKAEKMLYMTWSNGSLDWDLSANTANKPQAVIDNVIKQLHPGSNILMHELQWTVEAFDRLLTQLEEKGYSFIDPHTIDTDIQP